MTLNIQLICKILLKIPHLYLNHASPNCLAKAPKHFPSSSSSSSSSILVTNQMRTRRADLPITKLPKIKNINDNHKLSRRLTRENSINKGVMDDYYGGAIPVSVPFRWESQPGTPKVRFRESSLPPLTPPPSYFYSSPKTPAKTHTKKNPIPIPKPSLLGSIFTKRATRKKTNNLPHSPSSSSSSSSLASTSRSSSYSMPSPPTRASNFRERLSYDFRAQYDDEEDEEEEEEEDEYETHNYHNNNVSLSLALCLPRGANPRPKGWYSSLIKMLIKRSK